MRQKQPAQKLSVDATNRQASKGGIWQRKHAQPRHQENQETWEQHATYTLGLLASQSNPPTDAKIEKIA
jgi:hypothetical protein